MFDNRGLHKPTFLARPIDIPEKLSPAHVLV